MPHPGRIHQHFGAAEHDAVPRVLRDPAGNPDYVLNRLGESVQGCGAAGQGDASFQDVRSQLRRRLNLSEEALLTGSVNTVVNRDGVLYGYNTDVYGLTAQLTRGDNAIRGKAAFVLGTGGVSKSAAEAARRAGAKSVAFVSREKKDGAITYEALLARAGEAEYFINCTPVGMFPRCGVSPVTVADYPNLCGVTDLIYNPQRTELVRQAREKGLPAEGGLYMLCAQAVKAASLFFDRDFPPELAGEICEKLTKEK